MFRLLRGECVWRFLHTSPEEVDSIMSHVRDVGSWCEWQSLDIRQTVIMRSYIEEEEKIEREMKEMYIWEQGIDNEVNQKPTQKRTVHIGSNFGRVNMYILKDVLICRLCKKQSETLKPNSNVMWMELSDCILEYTVMDPTFIDVIDVHFEDTISQLLHSLL